MKMFVSVVDDAALWPHFVRYYRQMGVDQFFVATLPGNPPLPAVAPDVAIHTFPRVSLDNIHMGVHPVTFALRTEFAGADEWHWIADVDEFHEIDRPLDALLAEANALGCNTVAGRFVDRITRDGSLPPIGEQDIFEQFPVECDISHKLVGANNRKLQLIRGHLAPDRAYHFMKDERPFPREMRVHHFKWNASVLPRLTLRIQQEKEQGMLHWGESKRFLTHVAMHGRINVQAVRRVQVRVAPRRPASPAAAKG